jgi:hypothetical protein
MEKDQETLIEYVEASCSDSEFRILEALKLLVDELDLYEE